jgi:hypothetical protein
MMAIVNNEKQHTETASANPPAQRKNHGTHGKHAKHGNKHGIEHLMSAHHKDEDGEGQSTYGRAC